MRLRPIRADRIPEKGAGVVVAYPLLEPGYAGAFGTLGEVDAESEGVDFQIGNLTGSW
jgi:hypothetical protein